MEVIKRNGQIVPFDYFKIVTAIAKAVHDVDGNYGECGDLCDSIAESIAALNWDCISVEEIQDMVEEALMDSNRKDVARAYIRYRYKRENARLSKDDFMKSIQEKLEASNVENQNANVDEKSFGGRKGEASNVLLKQFALDFCVSEMARKNHLENMIYIHDLDNYVLGDHNCLTIPFDNLLKNGFNTRQVDIRPAKSVDTAFQLVAVIFQLQSLQQFGGVAASHLDWTMVPYVRRSFAKHYKTGLEYLSDRDTIDYEIETMLYNSQLYSIDDEEWEAYDHKVYKYALDMTEKELSQAVEGMYHNLNSLQSRSGNQLPFSSINYGTCTLPEGRMVIKALLEGSIKGVGKVHRTSIFPCGIFQLGKGINRAPGDPNYDLYRLALKSTAQRLYPNYANIDWSGNAGYDPNDPCTFFSTMGCRTANGWDINGLGQQKDGRGNICPVTIILPTLAMQAKEKMATLDYHDARDTFGEFMQILDQKIYEAKEMLLDRFEWICAQSPDSAKFMYENNLMAGYIPEEGIRSALRHGTLAVGQLGLAEALQIIFGFDHTTELGMTYAKEIESLFKKRCAEFKEQYKLNFGVYYTPKNFGLGVAQVTV